MIRAFVAGMPFVVALIASSTATAAPMLRLQSDQKGDVVLIGQTLAHDCRGAVPAPIVGTVGNCGSDTADGSADVFWQADMPAGGATADVSVSIAEARTAAVLQLPAGAIVTNARLYWAAKTDAAAADTTVTLDRPNVFTEVVNADDQWLLNTGNGDFYQATADVTATVAANGPGAFYVSGVDSVPLEDEQDQVVFTGWSLVVFYTAPGADTRNLALFDGFDQVSFTNAQSFNLSGFEVPSAFDAWLGIVTYEGDETVSGDELRLGTAPLTPLDRLFDPINPIDNFFNGTRGLFGVAHHVAGDLPELTGAADSMGGLDIDVVDITDRLSPGQMAVDVSATSSGDVYLLGPIITSIATVAPDLTSSTKTVVDLDGPPLLVGDELEYTIVVNNDGNDPAIDVMVTDTLPAAVEYVAGSLVVEGTAVTDADDADVGEVIGDVVTARVGVGADGNSGGEIAVGGSATVTFRATVVAAGTISNQAQVSGGGASGAPTETVPTDGDPGSSGSQPTDVTADECADDVHCDDPTPACDTAVTPAVCVECLIDDHCPDSAPLCDSVSQTCGPCTDDSECGASDSGRVCDGGGCIDGCRGENGNGCPDGLVCTSRDETVGTCEPPGSGGGGMGGMGGLGGEGGAPGGGGMGGAPGGGGMGGDPVTTTTSGSTATYEGSGIRCAIDRSVGRDASERSALSDHLWWLALGLGFWLRRRQAR